MQTIFLSDLGVGEIPRALRVSVRAAKLYLRSRGAPPLHEDLANPLIMPFDPRSEALAEAGVATWLSQQLTNRSHGIALDLVMRRPT